MQTTQSLTQTNLNYVAGSLRLLNNPRTGRNGDPERIAKAQQVAADRMKLVSKDALGGVLSRSELCQAQRMSKVMSELELPEDTRLEFLEYYYLFEALAGLSLDPLSQEFKNQARKLGAYTAAGKLAARLGRLAKSNDPAISLHQPVSDLVRFIYTVINENISNSWRSDSSIELNKDLLDIAEKLSEVIPDLDLELRGKAVAVILELDALQNQEPQTKTGWQVTRPDLKNPTMRQERQLISHR